MSNIVRVAAKEISEEQALSAFQDYTSNIAFNITLSRRQVQFLIDLHDAGQGEMVGSYNYFAPQLHQMQRRGLVAQRVVEEGDADFDKAFKSWHYKFYVTEPGKLVVRMLKLVGHKGTINVKRKRSKTK